MNEVEHEEHPLWKVLGWGTVVALTCFFGLVGTKLLNPALSGFFAIGIVALVFSGGWVYWIYNRLKILEGDMKHLKSKHKWLFADSPAEVERLIGAIEKLRPES